jgi:hypothetical protein
MSRDGEVSRCSRPDFAIPFSVMSAAFPTRAPGLDRLAMSSDRRIFCGVGAGEDGSQNRSIPHRRRAVRRTAASLTAMREG